MHNKKQAEATEATTLSSVKNNKHCDSNKISQKLVAWRERGDVYIGWCLIEAASAAAAAAAIEKSNQNAMKIKRTRGSCASTLSSPPTHTHTQCSLLAVDVILANNHNKAEQGPCQIDVSVIDTATQIQIQIQLQIEAQLQIQCYWYAARLWYWDIDTAADKARLQTNIGPQSEDMKDATSSGACISVPQPLVLSAPRLTLPNCSHPRAPKQANPI